MITLLRKELGVFFTSLTGIIVIMIFLVATGTFLWIIPGGANILDSGYATLESFFIIAPWLFLFLIPAVTMRLFSEEKKTGTIELLLTRPIGELGIVMAKFLAALSIVLIALIPTLVYFLSVYLLGNPTGNIDIGGTWGSYIGLFFLAAIYTAIGVFCSSLTSNQIIAFLLSLVISFLFFFAFDALGDLFQFSKTEFILEQLSIQAHYKSISRGVIDFSDMVYFIGVSAIFLAFTRIKLQSRTW